MIYLELMLAFMEIGAFTFGGGYAMLPLISSLVRNYGWLSDSELINFIAVSESTPGSFAVNISTYVGMETAGLAGAIISTLSVVLPSFVIILAVANFYDKFSRSLAVKGLMSGLKPAVIGLIGAAVVSTGQTVFFPSGFSVQTLATLDFISAAVIFAVMLVLSLKKMHPILIIALSAALGIGAGYLGEII